MNKQRYAKVFGSPGTRVRMTGLLHTQWPLLIVVMLAGYLLRAALPNPAISTTIVGILFLCLAVAVAAAANHSRNRLQSFIKGAKGEEVTARALNLLPKEFTVFHGLATHKNNFPVAGSGDLDHVVVGSNGIFVVETKNWKDTITIENGKLLYDGEEPTRPPLEQVKSETKSLRSYLKSKTGQDLQIQPILCFASNTLPQGQQGTVGVLVCNSNQLADVILADNENPISDSTKQAIITLLQKDCEQ